MAEPADYEDVQFENVSESRFEPGYSRLKTYDVELEEWAPVNRELRRYGLDTVSLLHPSRIEGSSDVIVLDTVSAKSLRQCLLTLLSDCDHRQTLVQDLILNNNQLKEELRLSQESNERIDSKAHDLKQMLENAQCRIKEVEDELVLHTQHANDEEERLRNTKHAAHSRNKHLEQRVQAQDEEIQRLKAKVTKLHDEDDRRVLRQHEVFERLKLRSARGGADDTLLDIIDSYESQLHQLRQELELFRTECDDVSPRSHDVISSEHNVRDASSNYKALIKSYDKELRTIRRKVNELEEKNELLKMELDSRPMMKDFRELQQKCKKYSRTLQRHNIPVTDQPDHKHPVKNLRKYSTHTDDIDYLPLDHCRRYLKHMCDLLQVDDLKQVDDTIKRQQAALETLPKMEEFCGEVLELTRGERHHGKHAVWCEKTWSPVIPTLLTWKQQIENTPELRESVTRLAIKLVPWKQYRFSQSGGVTDLITAVDYMASQESARDQLTNEPGSERTLDGIVKHFMTLFDVSSVAGVYARMNEVYRRLGEMQNLMRTLKQLLDLGDESSGVQVVERVGELRQKTTASATIQLASALQEHDLDQVCQKLELHDEFFPVFERIVNQLMSILEVKRMEQLIPAVRALKLLTG